MFGGIALPDEFIEIFAGIMIGLAECDIAAEQANEATKDAPQ